MMPMEVSPAHPGELVADLLEDTRLTKGEIAIRLGVSRQTLYRVLEGKSPVTADMAVRLGKLFGNGPQLWLNMQGAHDAWEAQQRLKREIERIPTLD
jgi:addiction module HigA family antidote